jgi:hypothetical protein
MPGKSKRTLRNSLIVSGVLSALVMGGIAAAPEALARPGAGNCTSLRAAESMWWNQYQYSVSSFGAQDSRTLNAFNQWDSAFDRLSGSGCGYVP